MATLFLSYKLEDRELAEQLQRELESLGHTIRVDTNAVLVGSGWRDSLMRALMESDAVVALITERSLQSPFVVSEIGAARALGQTGKKMALLPVIIGDMPIPQFKRGDDLRRQLLLQSKKFSDPIFSHFLGNKGVARVLCSDRRRNSQS